MRDARMSAPLGPLVRLAAATNLAIAGRTFRVDEDVPGADALRRALAAIGAVEDAAADYAFTTDGAAAVSLAAPQDRPVVIVECLPGTNAEGVAPHAGVLRTTRSDVVIVPAGASAPQDAVARIEWARRFMPVSRSLAAELGEEGLLAGLRVGLSLVLEPKTAVLALLLTEAGAAVSVFAFAAETDDAVAAALGARGVAVHATAGATPAEEHAHALAFLDDGLDLLIDDGAHVLRLAHAERPAAVARLIGASEETTSGLTPLRAMAADGALQVPVIAANDARSKTWFDNRHGTGETCVFAILGVLGDLAGVPVAVVGFGPVGEGVAQVLAAVGAEVVVVDTDPVRALAATYAGYRIATLHEAVAGAEVVVSATGVPGTLDLHTLQACAPDAAIAVAGGAPEEVALTAAREAGARREPVGPHLERLVLSEGHTIRLLAGGDCVNIVAGQGNPIGIMDLSFGVQLGALRMLVERPGSHAPGVHPIDPAADERVATLAGGLPASATAAPPTPPPWRRTRFDAS